MKMARLRKLLKLKQNKEKTNNILTICFSRFVIVCCIMMIQMSRLS